MFINSAMTTLDLHISSLRTSDAVVNETTAAAVAAADTGAFDFKLYRYDVSLPAAIIALVIFAILTASHIWRIQRHQSFYFTAFTIGGLFQVLGYSGRIWSHYDPNAIGGFVIQAILILVAPALYAASIYMILGRLIAAIGAQDLSIIPLKWMTKLFVVGDVVSFFLQAGGGGMQSAGTLELYDAGEKIIIVGLFVQIVMFGFFLVTTATFHVCMARGHKKSWQYSRQQAQPLASISWERHLTVLYVASALIMVRSIFRVVEYLQGNRGHLISHEIFLYLFDALLMALVMFIFLVWYVDDLSWGPQMERTVGKYGSGVEMLPSRDSHGLELERRE